MVRAPGARKEIGPADEQFRKGDWLLSFAEWFFEKGEGREVEIEFLGVGVSFVRSGSNDRFQRCGFDQAEGS